MPRVDQNRQFTKKKKKKPAGKAVVIKKAAGGAKPDSVRAQFARETDTASGGREGGRDAGIPEKTRWKRAREGMRARRTDERRTKENIVLRPLLMARR